MPADKDKRVTKQQCIGSEVVNLPERKTAVIAALSSGIGVALANRLLRRGWNVEGTSRKTVALPGVNRILPCDFSDPQTIDAATASLSRHWDLLVLAPGTLNPVGPFRKTSFDEWEQNIATNLTGPLRFTQAMLRKRIVGPRPATCLFFAGGGVNSAPLGVSAYTTAKIALIKAVELLDAEVDDVKFCILGPGWVHTPIHQQVLESEFAPQELLTETKRRLREADFVPMDKVLQAVDWIIDSPKAVVGGRNFSAAHDPIESANFLDQLALDTDAFKLRRHKNSIGELDGER